MVTSYREETFQRGRRDALGALVDALKEERIPVRSRYGLTTGKIEEYLDDIYLPLQPRTLLSGAARGGRAPRHQVPVLDLGSLCAPGTTPRALRALAGGTHAAPAARRRVGTSR